MSSDLLPQIDSPIFCRVSINNDEKWVHGIITYINLDKNIAEIFLSAKYFKSYFSEGSKIVIKSLDENCETLFTGSVSKKVISIRKQAITIQISKVLSYNNQRKHERFRVNYSCRVRYEENISYIANISDISLGGGLIHSDDFFEEGRKIDIDVFVTPKITISFTCKIIRRIANKSGGYSYGVQLANIDDENYNLLSELIEYLQTQKKHLAQEWNMFNRLKYSVYAISILGIFLLIFVVFASKAI
ncbi:type IV pilus assembly PilZ [Acetivibrio straminisolvens JCM 21531]|uniref:Type IV pilus assembly PilZ n=1 Tax=Acetivibrio straminisolvens JCM 21531 TaxID=1294263 RepID=W4V899_9FIRM|nr:PilZ domain-containing protein [Acetivibrio straminisolvens]GAE89053.1 type IV pilus assembly PilZ [Acetivibrio straminisolvens JCM 21531]